MSFFPEVAAPKIRSGLIMGQLPAHTHTHTHTVEVETSGKLEPGTNLSSGLRQKTRGGLHVPTRVPGVHVSLQGQLNARPMPLFQRLEPSLRRGSVC